MRRRERDDVGGRGHRPGLALARAALARAFAELEPGTSIDIDRVTHAGGGCSRDVYVAHVDVGAERRALSGAYAVFLPRHDAEPGVDAAARREAKLLPALAQLDL